MYGVMCDSGASWPITNLRIDGINLYDNGTILRPSVVL